MEILAGRFPAQKSLLCEEKQTFKVLRAGYLSRIEKGWDRKRIGNGQKKDDHPFLSHPFPSLMLSCLIFGSGLTIRRTQKFVEPNWRTGALRPNSRHNSARRTKIQCLFFAENPGVKVVLQIAGSFAKICCQDEQYLNNIRQCHFRNGF